MNHQINGVALPDEQGFFGEYGGQFIPPHLKQAMDQINLAYEEIRHTPEFQQELADLFAHYVGRPSPLFHAKRLSDQLGGAQIYLKREDLNHTGAHKINHCLGEALLAKYMGKTKVIAETGAGQHGVALATACALVGIPCEIHMGQVDIEKEHPNVVKMKILGVKLVSVTRGTAGAFSAFLNDRDVKLVGVEPAGHGLDTPMHSASLTLGKPSKLHGMACYVLEDEHGEPLPVHSIASGLDYPGVGPQHSYLKDIGRVEYATASDEECLAAFMTLSRVEGIVPALESSHAVAWAIREAPKMPKEIRIIVNLSGRGDKDSDYVAAKLGL